jgi:CubicO group peptidase (beta-lactamase class C family)
MTLMETIGAEVASPEAAGMSSQRLARIAPTMEAFVKDNRLPGVMTLLQRRGKVVHFGKFGLTNIEAGVPIKEDTIFRIYSMTKPVVSVAAMMLLEEGRFRLNDPVSKFIPAFAKTKVYAGSSALGLKLADQQTPITLHHLLTHTSGLSYGWFFDSPVEDLYRKAIPELFLRTRSLQQVVERIAEIPLLFQPGTQWRYSYATDVLGYVVQVVADMPLADFLAQRIFKPLGMIDTAFQVAPEKASRLAQIYASKALYEPDPIPADNVPLIGDVTQTTQCPSSGGGLTSTLSDYLKFCNCLLNNGSYEGTQLIGRKTLALMTANHIPDRLMPLMIGANELDHGFGLGFRVATDLGKARALTSVGEYGWAGAAQTYFWIDPSEDFIGLMMTQHMPLDVYPVQQIFRNLAYQAIAD